MPSMHFFSECDAIEFARDDDGVLWIRATTADLPPLTCSLNLDRSARDALRLVLDALDEAETGPTTGVP